MFDFKRRHKLNFIWEIFAKPRVTLNWDSNCKMEYPCIDCGSNVRLRQEALQCDQCSQWQHRLCNTGKTFLSNCIAFVYYLTPQIINKKSRNVVYWKHCQFPQLLTRHYKVWRIFVGKTNKSVRFNEMKVPGLS